MNFSTDPDEQIDMLLRSNNLGVDDGTTFKMDFLEQPQLEATSPILSLPHNNLNGITNNGPTDNLLSDDYLVNSLNHFPCSIHSPKPLEDYNNNSILNESLDTTFSAQPPIIPNIQITQNPPPAAAQTPPPADNPHTNSLNISNLSSLSGLNLPNLNALTMLNINFNLNSDSSENQSGASTQPEIKSYVLPDVSKNPSNAQILFLMKNMAKLAGSLVSNTKSKTEPLPTNQKMSSNEENEFDSVCSDPALTFNPKKLGFIPSKFWEDKEMTFGELVSNFFRRKSNSNNRFYHKLFNALKITEEDPLYSDYVGVEWATPKVIKVDKKKFARLLGIKSIDGSLFHHQGNFPSHGFVELTTQNVYDYFPSEKIDNVDFDNVRLLIHQSGVFVQGCTEEVINDCKWINVRKGPQYYH